MVDHVVLIVEDCNPSVPQCRICHEEEDEDPKNLESPCGCSGTLKFAHRKCIQRWCNEKGNTICEICSQKFEPGYTEPAKKEIFELVPVFIRGGNRGSIEDRELQNPGLIAIVSADRDFLASNYRESSVSTCCRASGILLPFYIMAHAISAIQRRQQENLQYDGLHTENYEDDDIGDTIDDDDDDDDDIEQQQAV